MTANEMKVFLISIIVSGSVLIAVAATDPEVMDPGFLQVEESRGELITTGTIGDEPVNLTTRRSRREEITFGTAGGRVIEITTTKEKSDEDELPDPEGN